MMCPNDFGEDLQVRQQRFTNLLQLLLEKGVAQSEIARRVGVPASYLTDVKKGHRGMTELFARRLAEEFHLDFRWLLGETGTMDPLQLGNEVVHDQSSSLWLPIFSHPVRGQPRRLPVWDGTSVEVCGAAAARARAASEPYILRFLRDDHTGRLRSNDLLLISQAANDIAEIHVVKVRNKLFLARHQADGTWERVAEKGQMRGDVDAVGHVIGIVWASLSE